MAIVDDADYCRVAAHKWYVWKKRGYDKRYAIREAAGRTLSMHRFITAAPDGSEVDHRDHDGLNNTRANLRVCTKTENQWNRRPSPHSSRFKGVHWSRQCQRWVAKIRANGAVYHLGLFEREEAAAEAYRAESIRLRGEFAQT